MNIVNFVVKDFDCFTFNVTYLQKVAKKWCSNFCSEF